MLSQSIISSTVSIAIVFTLIFYFCLDHVRLLTLSLELFPRNERAKLKKMLLDLSQVSGKYISGNISISLIFAATITIVMLVLGVPYALPLGVFAGVMDLLPLVGATIGAVPAILIAFSISPIKGFILMAVHIIYQQFENSILAPMVYKKTLDISQALSFLAVIIGAGLFGVVGAFIALPIAASIPVLLRYKDSREG